jgi:hypothetical protein
VLGEVEELYGQAESDVLGVLSRAQREALHEATLRVLSAHTPESWLDRDN